jgi:hypothetical protein
MESFEEDIVDYNSESITMNSEDINNDGVCSYPESLVTGDAYNKSDKRFYVFDSGKFLQGKCLNIEDELKPAIKSDLSATNLTDISNIFTIGHGSTSPTGYGCMPTLQGIYKLNFDYPYYINIASLYRIFDEPDVNKWYMVKLFNGKRKRLHNLAGIRGVSMHHCQVEGYHIYKLFKREELLSGVNLDANVNDFVVYEQIAYNREILDVICRKTQGMTLAEFKQANQIAELTRGIERINVLGPTGFAGNDTMDAGNPDRRYAEYRERANAQTEEYREGIRRGQELGRQLATARADEQTRANETRRRGAIERIARQRAEDGENRFRGYRDYFYSKLQQRLNKTRQEIADMELQCSNGHELNAQGVCKKKCGEGQGRNFGTGRCRAHVNNRIGDSEQ